MYLLLYILLLYVIFTISFFLFLEHLIPQMKNGMNKNTKEKILNHNYKNWINKKELKEILYLNKTELNFKNLFTLFII